MKDRIKNVGMIPIFAICVICVIGVFARYGRNHSGVETFLYTLMAAIAILCFSNLVRIEEIPRVGKVLCIFGELSYFMYLNEYFLLITLNPMKNFMNCHLVNSLIIFSSIILGIVMKYIWSTVQKHIKIKRLNIFNKQL